MRQVLTPSADEKGLAITEREFMALDAALHRINEELSSYLSSETAEIIDRATAVLDMIEERAGYPWEIK